MTRRFTLSLDDDLHEAFLLLYPDFGLRTAIIRRCIKRVVAYTKETSVLTGGAVDEMCDKVVDHYRDE